MTTFAPRVRSVSVLLPLLAGLLLATAANGRATAVEPLRVMSFNVRYGTAPDGENAWPKRRDLAFAVVRDFAPDVLCLQEALDFQIDELLAAVPGYVRLGVGRDDGKNQGEFSAVLYRKERLRELVSDTFWLSDTPDVPGSKHWGNEITRICTWTSFVDRSAERSPQAGDPALGKPVSFRVYNTHWDHQSQPARERSARLMTNTIAAHVADKLPVLVTGDFNAAEDNPAFRALLGGPAGLADTFRKLHPQAKEVGTFHGFQGTVAGGKIDAILASRHWQVLDAEIVRTQRDGRFPSDHFPVTAVVQLRGDGE